MRVAPDGVARFTVCQYHQIDTIEFAAERRGRRVVQHAGALRYRLHPLPDIHALPAQRRMAAPDIRELLRRNGWIAARKIDHLPDRGSGGVVHVVLLHSQTAGACARR
ncbi:hypothetical protein SDC9_124007 [bioreactor metagenome]|uniref:Uncharacterized protein n=1 Tax=bioreactor metagenome TaxID=1076179 RepID=A0A645CJC6_9ZZZZ